MSTKSAVILLSGGLDSATTLAIAKDQGYDCYALTFQYGAAPAKERPGVLQRPLGENTA